MPERQGAGARLRAAAAPASLCGRSCVVATMHGKEQVIGSAFAGMLGMRAILARELDTDVFGAFSGEVERVGSALETTIRKARAGMALTGVDAGVSSEGSYGAHPVYPFLPGGTEVMSYVDDGLGVAVSETIIVEKTNFSHRVAAPQDGIDDFLNAAGFPLHAVIVRPHVAQPNDDKTIVKGVTDRASLSRAISDCASRSGDRRVLIETDMRAHVNPTRMAEIARLAGKLARRLVCACPVCAAPGFGKIGQIAGLPCEDCGGDSTLVRRLVFGCARCDYTETRPRPDGRVAASPTYCLRCNT